MKIFLNFFLLFFLVSKNCFSQHAITEKPVLAASINPVYQIILAITKDENDSILIIDPNFSEHDYQLKKSDVESFSKADLVFYSDDNLEIIFPKMIKKFSAEKKSYRLSEVSGLKLLQKRDGSKKLDPHIWLNPKNAIQIAEFMTQKICEIDHKNSQKYQKNLREFRNEVVETEKIIHSKLLGIQGLDYVIYHDGYQYFEDYFGVTPLKVMSREHSRDVSVKDVRELDMLTKSHQIKCIFGEILDEKNSAKKLAESYKIKFATLSLIGSKKNFSAEKNGYSSLLIGIADNMTNCLNPFKLKKPNGYILNSLRRTSGAPHSWGTPYQI